MPAKKTDPAPQSETVPAVQPAPLGPGKAMLLRVVQGGPITVTTAQYRAAVADPDLRPDEVAELHNWERNLVIYREDR